MMPFLYYIKKRFPILPAIAFSYLLSATSISYGKGSSASLSETIIPCTLLFLFLFRLRLWDEVKDATYDALHHPDRPVPSGLLSLSFIAHTSLVVLLLEILLQLSFSLEIATLFLVTVLYSYLMFEEFFFEKFLRRHILLYALSHQFIFLFYILYFFSIGNGSVYLPSSSRDIFMITALFLLPFIYEIGRKCRHRMSPEGVKTDDTYVFQWGNDRAFLFLIFLFILESIALYALIGVNMMFVIYLGALSIPIVFYPFFHEKILETAPLWSMGIGMYALILLNVIPLWS